MHTILLSSDQVRCDHGRLGGRVSLDDDENNRKDDKEDKRLLSPMNAMTDGMELPPHHQVAKKDGNTILDSGHHPFGPLGNDENFENNKPNGSSMYAMMPPSFLLASTKKDMTGGNTVVPNDGMLYAMPPSFLLASPEKNMTTGGGGMDLPTHPGAQLWPHNHPSCPPIGDGDVGGNNTAIFKNGNPSDLSQNEQLEGDDSEEGGDNDADDDEGSDDAEVEDEEDNNEADKTQQNSLSVAPPAPLLQPVNQHPYSQCAPPPPFYPQPPYAMPYQMTSGPTVVVRPGTNHQYNTANGEPFSFCLPTANGVVGRASVARLLSVSESFPEKLYNMLDACDREGLVDIVGWLSHGRAFAIHKPRLFVSQVLPRFFRQTKLTSFQRQLNLYGFRRISDGPDNGGYYHKFLIRGRPDLTVHLKRMVRPKGSPPQAKRAPDPEPNFYALPPCLPPTPNMMSGPGASAIAASGGGCMMYAPPPFYYPPPPYGFGFAPYTLAQPKGSQGASPPLPVYQPLPPPASEHRYLNPMASTTPLQTTASSALPPHEHQQQQPKMQAKYGMPAVSPVTAARPPQESSAPTAAETTPVKELPSMDDGDSGKIFSDTPLAITRGVEMNSIDGAQGD